MAFAWLLATSPEQASAESLTGRITSITDGDTLDLLTPDEQTIRIRLAQIDAPEKRQPFGIASKQTLSDLAFGKPATVDVREHDRYGRAVGLVRVGDIDVNAEMVRRGMAWVS